MQSDSEYYGNPGVVVVESSGPQRDGASGNVVGGTLMYKIPNPRRHYYPEAMRWTSEDWRHAMTAATTVFAILVMIVVIYVMGG